MRKFTLVIVALCLLVLGAVHSTSPAQDIQNTFVRLAAQIQDGIITSAKLASTSGGGTVVPTTVTASWTPALEGGSTPGTGQTYSAQVGTSVRNGNEVRVYFSMTVTSAGTAAGAVRITGLPITAATTSGTQSSCSISFYSVTGLAASNFGLTGFVGSNTNYIQIWQNGSTSTTTLSVAQAGTPTLVGLCTYLTT